MAGKYQFRRQGFPEEGELVLCTVTKVQFHSVFVNIDEYDKQGMIHISEVSPGRIRNIRDYVKEGKVIVCKILRINRERGHIDLSLRRVSDNQRRNKVDEIKQEQKSEKIIEGVAFRLKKDFKALYKEIAEKVFKQYDMINVAFREVVEEDLKLESLGIDKKIANELEILIRERIKPKVVEIGGSIVIETYDSDGISVIKEAITKASTQENVTIKYLGAGKYSVTVTDNDYKDAEKCLKKSLDSAEKIILKHDGTFEFERKEK